MPTFDSSVKFNAGAPIDVNKLNKLQDNISSIYETNSSLLNTTNTTVGNIQTAVRVFPIIDKGTQKLIVNGNQQVFNFSNPNFTEAPTVVASIAVNPKKEALYTVSAIPKGQRQYALEVTSSKDNTGTTVEVNWIAIQMKEISVS